MKEYYLAVDIGASSGRHILAWLEEGQIKLEEVYRFSNGMVKKEGSLCWELDRLFEEILKGMEVCKKIGKIPVSMGIDTWAVDYVLLDGEGTVLGNTYGYRDHRTDGMDKVVYGMIPEEELYRRTGIQKQIFNTIYQLTAAREKEPELLLKAEKLLMIPDYFGYLLTGIARTEYTNATTTQLINPKTHNWDFELIEKLGIEPSLFTEIAVPGTVLGSLKKEIEERIGYNLTVIQAATHDTASAVAAVPALKEDFLYISSGTWSLMGVEQKEANCSDESRKRNFTNEGGYEYRYRFLKNIMGLWMIQSVRHEYEDRYSFGELCQMAKECDDFPARVDVNDDRFLSPESMIEALKEVCRENGQKVPETPGEMAKVIYRSLADSYGQTVKEIEELTGKQYESIHVVGGGANADYLNQLTADSTGKKVYCGPTEATAIGNLVVQMIQRKEFENLGDARKAIFRSFEIKEFIPEK